MFKPQYIAIIAVVLALIISGLLFMPKKALTPTRMQDLTIVTLSPGTGPEAKNGDAVSVNYTGTLTNGTVFDTNIGKGAPFTFTLGAGEVIAGWDQGVLGMKKGEKRKLTIDPALAYGEREIGPIPPSSTLIFEVELLGINNPTPTPLP